LAVGIAVFVFLVFQFADSNPDLLEKLVTLIVGLVGGFGGGVAYRASKDRNS
jgi:hypothetical protein